MDFPEVVITGLLVHVDRNFPQAGEIFSHETQGLVPNVFVLFVSNTYVQLHSADSGDGGMVGTVDEFPKELRRSEEERVRSEES